MTTTPITTLNRRQVLISSSLVAATGLSGCLTTGTNPGQMTMVGQYEKKLVRIDKLNMAYVEAGEGDPIVFLHGNPTSSYIWRNIIPYAEPFGRCLAPDLMGMGDSSKIKRATAESYTFAEHAKYLDTFLAKLNATENITFVVHDWGSALAFNWAQQHPEKVRGIAHMESYFIPPTARSSQTAGARPLFDVYFTPEGERFVLEQNGYIEQVLLASLSDKLKSRDIFAYTKPFQRPDDRRPVLAWAQQVPFAGKPAATWDVISSYTQWLEQAEFPKLFVRASPGSIIQDDMANFVSSLPNQRQAVVHAGHYLQEDAPDEVGTLLSSWLERDVGLIRHQTEDKNFLPVSLDSAINLFK